MAYREVARVEIQEIVRRKPQVVFQDEEGHAFLPWNGESTMRSPTGATPRSTRTTTSSTSSLSIRCLSPSALLARRWRSGWTASWCTSTVGAACSRPTSTSLGMDGPPNPPSSRPTPPGLPTASKPATGSWTPPWPISPTGSWKAPCPGPSSGRATSSSALANATSMVIHDLHVYGPPSSQRKHIRHWRLIRMLYWPARSPERVSSLLLGNPARSRREAALSNTVSGNLTKVTLGQALARSRLDADDLVPVG